eukprot:4332946-Amphidinium_carterae.1
MLKAVCSCLFEHKHIELGVKVKPESDELVSFIAISSAPGDSRSQAGILDQWVEPPHSTITRRSFRQSLIAFGTCESEL